MHFVLCVQPTRQQTVTVLLWYHSDASSVVDTDGTNIRLSLPLFFFGRHLELNVCEVQPDTGKLGGGLAFRRKSENLSLKARRRA